MLRTSWPLDLAGLLWWQQLWQYQQRLTCSAAVIEALARVHRALLLPILPSVQCMPRCMPQIATVRLDVSARLLEW